MRLLLFLSILLIATPLVAAGNLLIVDVYARILPEGQIEPVPDPFLEAILSAKQVPLPASVQQLQGKTFQIRSASRDFEAVIPSVDMDIKGVPASLLELEVSNWKISTLAGLEKLGNLTTLNPVINCTS
jgi:hypothetical protein